MQPIEGITPEALWTFLVVLVGLGALIVLGDKVMDVWRKHKARKAVNEGPEGHLAEEISKKVMEKLEPRFSEIDRKLANDKALLEDHTKQLAAYDTRFGRQEEGQRALCRGVLALLSHEINGNSVDKCKEALEIIKNHLIEK